ncbi:MAG: calcineurin-like phosphoesterase C-terminal domain-containing protein [Gammaproteobacteria bacterium]
MNKLAMLCIFGAISVNAQAQDQSAQGFVFDDKNRNGRLDAGEPGVPGVAVSNGIDVVQTRADGSYSIALDAQSILFISQPARYAVPVDAQNLPRFYYIHYPDGTPDASNYQFPVIEPTGPLPTAINFPLRKSERADKFDALAFADPQTSDAEELDFLREDVVAELVGSEAKFGLVAGDVVNDDLSLYLRHNEIMSRIGVPIWNLPGNHDMNYDSPDDRYATETFKRTFGPTYYSFDYGQVHVVALDNVEYQGSEVGEYRGFISPEQIAWLKNDLRFVPRDKLILIATHIPLLTFATDNPATNTGNLDQLLAVLKGRRHVYTIAGHDTSNSWQVYIDHEHGWHGPKPLHHQVLAEVRGGSWAGPRDERGVREASMQDGNPNGYYIISFDGNEYHTRFKAASQGAEEQMRIVLDPPLIAMQEPGLNRGQLAGPTKVVVNVFDGGERNEVQMSLDDGRFRRMRQVLRNDPYMDQLFIKYQGTEDAYAAPEPSSYIWELDLPGYLTPGMHTVTVRSTDMFGRTSTESLVFEIL